jgi:hypothetical protein
MYRQLQRVFGARAAADTQLFYKLENHESKPLDTKVRRNCSRLTLLERPTVQHRGSPKSQIEL